MSSIYNLEPQTFGHITFKTTFGDIDIELFTKQCPKATRNFVQLCLDGFYEDTIFERVEKDFIAVGGSSNDGEEDDVDTFPDEFHSRLRFTRRGLLATANTDKNANGSKFFFTLGATPELQNKHTIFGRAKGDSIYTLVNLNESQVDVNLRPLSEKKIEKIIIHENPYPELLPREERRRKNVQQDIESSPEYDPLSKPKPTKTAKKLSFLKYSDEDDDDSDIELARVERADKPSEQTADTDDFKANDPNIETQTNAADSGTDLSFNSRGEESHLSDTEAKEKKLCEIRAQIEALKRQIENDSKTNPSSKRRKRSNPADEDTHNGNAQVTGESNPDDRVKSSSRTKKSETRELETLELVNKFKKKLKEVTKHTLKQQQTSSGDIANEHDDGRPESGELDDLLKVDGDDWLRHTFVAEEDTRMAKDANTKGDDWYSVEDPRYQHTKVSSVKGQHSTDSHKRSHSPSRRYRSRDSHRHRG